MGIWGKNILQKIKHLIIVFHIFYNLIMTPKKFLFMCFALLCPLFIQAEIFDFHPVISLAGYNSSPTNTRSKNYGQGTLTLPLWLYFGQKFSVATEYFFAYDYFDKEKDTYDKLNRANFIFNTNNFTLKAGRDFLDIGLNSIIYFGHHADEDLKKPTYFDGAFASFDFGKYFNITAFGGTFDKRDFYGATLETSFIKGFYLLAKEKDLDLSTFGAKVNIEYEIFALDLIAAFNNGTERKEILGLTFEEEYKGKMFSGDIKFKKQREDFDSEFAFGIEYLSPTKENSFGFRPFATYLDRGFIFRNLTEELETLTYKLGLQISPKIIKDLSFAVNIYNFSSTDKRKTSRDIASEIDLSLSYKLEHFSAKFIYGYLQAQNGFSDYTTGFEDKPSINKLGLILTYQF